MKAAATHNSPGTTTVAQILYNNLNSGSCRMALKKEEKKVARKIFRTLLNEV